MQKIDEETEWKKKKMDGRKQKKIRDERRKER